MPKAQIAGGSRSRSRSSSMSQDQSAEQVDKPAKAKKSNVARATVSSAGREVPKAKPEPKRQRVSARPIESIEPTIATFDDSPEQKSAADYQAVQGEQRAPASARDGSSLVTETSRSLSSVESSPADPKGAAVDPGMTREFS